MNITGGIWSEIMTVRLWVVYTTKLLTLLTVPKLSYNCIRAL